MCSTSYAGAGRRLLTNVKVVAAGCMEACLTGPALLVVPGDGRPSEITEADVPALVDQHLIAASRTRCSTSARGRLEDFSA